MKSSKLQATVTVNEPAKILAVIITMLNGIWIGDVKRIIKALVCYYEVEL